MDLPPAACEQWAMPQSPRRRLALALTTLAAVLTLPGLGALSGCSSSEAKADWEGAENLQFSEDARDPTERQTEGGWYRFRPREDPVGTASPLDTDRRTHGFGAANNDP